MKLKFPQKIEARKSKISGLGVFAKEDIKMGEILEECHIISFEQKKEDVDKAILNNYTYKWDSSPNNFVICFGLGSIYNSSEDVGVRYNVKLNIKKELSLFQFIADRDINKNEEILLCYETDFMKKNKEVVTSSNSKEVSLFLNSKIEIMDSKISGRGVFAKEDIKMGEILEECHHVVLEKKFNYLPKKLKEYVFAWSSVDTETKDVKFGSSLVFGMGSIYNHQKDNNADWIRDSCRDVFAFYAKKNIKKGEEIYTNYGDGYVQNVGTNTINIK